MGFLQVLALVFVILKLVGLIDWSWWLVLSPMLFTFVFYFILLLIVPLGALAFGKKRK